MNGAAPSVQIFAKGGTNTASLADKLEKLVAANEAKNLKGLVNVVDGTKESLEKLAAEKNLSKIALCYSTNKGDLDSYKINPEATNTVIVYKGKKVTANFANLEAKEFSKLEEAVKTVLQ